MLSDLFGCSGCGGYVLWVDPGSSYRRCVVRALLYFGSRVGGLEEEISEFEEKPWKWREEPFCFMFVKHVARWRPAR